MKMYGRERKESGHLLAARKRARRGAVDEIQEALAEIEAERREQAEINHAFAVMQQDRSLDEAYYGDVLDYDWDYFMDPCCDSYEPWEDNYLDPRDKGWQDLWVDGEVSTPLDDELEDIQREWYYDYCCDWDQDLQDACDAFFGAYSEPVPAKVELNADQDRRLERMRASLNWKYSRVKR